jgi:hypothetical protein
MGSEMALDRVFAPILLNLDVMGLIQTGNLQ